MKEHGKGSLGSVIIVDADRILLDTLKRGLSAKGYSCETTEDAGVAKKLVERRPFDIMIVEVSNSRSDGFDLIRKTKKLRPGLAVIVMSGSIDEPLYEIAMEYGASDFILKPASPSEVLLRVNHARLHEKLREMSKTDELTGLYNRRGFFTLAEHQLKIANRMKKGIYLLFADFDKLKDLNDTFGHREGDLALMKTAEVLKDTFRDSDIIARISGDEFVVFPIGTAESDVDRIIDRLQANLQIYNSKRTGRGVLSLSIGIAFYDPRNPSSVDELLIQADRSMYDRKKGKRV